MIIVVDDEDRENEGDLVLAAEKATPEAINFIPLYGRGLICVALPAERLETLRIPMMTPSGANTSRFEMAFTVSVDAQHGTTTGISASDRAITVRALADPATKPEDLVRAHSECLTGEVFGSLRCDCGPQLEQAMALIGAEGRGVILYMRQEGRGIGLCFAGAGIGHRGGERMAGLCR